MRTDQSAAQLVVKSGCEMCAECAYVELKKG
jgi:hypothetical protein